MSDAELIPSPSEDRAARMGKLPASWLQKRLADLVDDVSPIVYGIVQAGPDFPGGIPYIKAQMSATLIRPNTLSRTSPEIASKYARSTVQPGDIVFSLRGNIGALSIVPAALPCANLTQGTARIRPRKGVVAEFLAYALCAPALQERISSVCKGSTFREISLEELRKLELLVPPHSTQKRIAALLRTWD